MRVLTLTTPAPPAGTTFTAVQVEASTDGQEWRIVGAETTSEAVRDREGNTTGRYRLLTQVGVACKLTDADTLVRAHWVCEDSSLGLVMTGPHHPDEQPRRRR